MLNILSLKQTYLAYKYIHSQWFYTCLTVDQEWPLEYLCFFGLIPVFWFNSSFLCFGSSHFKVFLSSYAYSSNYINGCCTPYWIQTGTVLDTNKISGMSREAGGAAAETSRPLIWDNLPTTGNYVLRWLMKVAHSNEVSE